MEGQCDGVFQREAHQDYVLVFQKEILQDSVLAWTEWKHIELACIG